MGIKKIGTVNGIVICTVWEKGKVIAQCADTPNARAYAYAKHPKALYTKAHYVGWSAAIRFRKDESQNRIDNQGWLASDESASYRLV